MFTGLTVATIGGVPLATWAGDVLGWRTAFAGIAGVGAVAMLSLRLALPSMPANGDGDVRAELRVLTRAPRWRRRRWGRCWRWGVSGGCS